MGEKNLTAIMKSLSKYIIRINVVTIFILLFLGLYAIITEIDGEGWASLILFFGIVVSIILFSIILYLKKGMGLFSKKGTRFFVFVSISVSILINGLIYLGLALIYGTVFDVW